MKQTLFIALAICNGFAYAQPKMITNATINTTTNVIAPEEEDVANVQTQGGPGGGGMGAMFRNFGDGETKTVTQVKNDLVKTLVKTEMSRVTIIRNNETKLTTTLMEMMGNKTGFYISDAEQEELKKRMDSMMQARSKDTAARKMPAAPAKEVPVELSYTEETKKIAGYQCKKVYVISTRLLGLKDTVTAWYTPEFKINNLPFTGGTGGMGFTMGGSTNASGTNGLDKVDGFVMRYETRMRRNRTMIVEVTKIDISKDIAAKEFDIPKDFDLKPMKEMTNMMGGQGGPGGDRMQFQIRREN